MFAYLDINEMLEEISLTKKICIPLDGIGKLEIKRKSVYWKNDGTTKSDATGIMDT